MVESAARAQVTPSHKTQPRRVTTPKTMDLQYFLEMVDVKHRHGSNLRAYHSVWKDSPSNQNFFYWLDYGEGKDVDLEHRPRGRLEKEQIRYLSPEERLKYMVKVDENGMFRWVKNDELVETDNKRFKDSIHGVVRIDDRTPRFRGNPTSETPPSEPELSSSSSSSSPRAPQTPPHDESLEKVQLSTDQDYELGKAVKKFSHIKPEAIYDHFAGTFSKRDGMWIFVSTTKQKLAYILTLKHTGCRHVISHLHWNQGARCLSTLLISERRPYRCSRHAQDPPWTAKKSGSTQV